MTSTVPTEPLRLRGDAFERGVQQARLCPQQVGAVRAAVDGRLAGLGLALHAREAQDFLAAQWRFCALHDLAGLAETQGIAAGFGLAPETLFAYLHANVLADMAAVAAPEHDGCTAWAATRTCGNGAWVVKNRDYGGEHGALQRVFLHADPAWGARSMACVGSLGSPGAFSSGINSDGLAVVDTQVDTGDHGVGWLRYFLMTHLLRSCDGVASALEQIRVLPHAGGGCLVLGDASGAVAAVELGHRVQLRDAPNLPWTVRTNHFTDDALSPCGLSRKGNAAVQDSMDRHARVSMALRRKHEHLELTDIQALMSTHDSAELAGCCRHGQGSGTLEPDSGDARQGGSRTLSCVIYQTRIPTLLMSHGAPCCGPWHTYVLRDAGQ